MPGKLRFLCLITATLVSACGGNSDDPAAADASVSGESDAQAEASADDAAVLHSCEAVTGSSSGAACDFDGSCSWGEECCCGQCYASNVCTCTMGTTSCHATDACYHVTCDAGPSDS